MAVANCEYVIGKHVLQSDIANARVAGLTKERIDAWRNNIIGDTTDPELRRRKMATCNRTWTTLKASLNYAVKQGKCEAGAWSDVSKHKQCEKARERFLSIEEAQLLVKHCDANLKPLVEAALGTGARYSELANLEVRDFDSRTSTLKIRTSKTGHSRTLRLSDESAALFRTLSAGRNGSERLFSRADGEPWGPGNQTKPFRAACERAGLGSDVLFHSCRHTWASLSIMAGMPLLVVAGNLGPLRGGRPHTAEVERTYDHLFRILLPTLCDASARSLVSARRSSLWPSHAAVIA